MLHNKEVSYSPLPKEVPVDLGGNGVYLPELGIRSIQDTSKKILKILKTAPARIPEEKRSTIFLKRFINTAALIFADILAISAVHILAVGKSLNLQIMVPIFLFSALSGNLYSKKFPFWDEFVKLIKVSALSTLLYMGYLLISGKNVNILFAGILLSGISLLSTFIRFVVKELLWIFGVRFKVLIIGGGLGGQKIIRALDSERGLGYEIIGVLDDDRTKQWKPIGKFRGRDVLIIGRSEDIWDILQESQVDEVILAIPSLGDKVLTALAIHLQKFVPVVTIVPDMFGLPTTVEVGHFFGEQSIFLSVKNNLSNPVNRLLKELFDKIVGTIIFLTLAIPIIIIAILIKIDSPGPIFFAHERVGKNGKRFKCLKFRTMYVNNEEILREYLKNHPEIFDYYTKTGKIPGEDPRVTRIGRFLRKFSLDELPQIINVLKGDMSLVGPRPLVPTEVEFCKEYYMEWAKYVKPGMTGLAQVMGRAKISHIDKNMISIWYVRNWSLWLDITILLKTAKVVLTAEGAY